MLFLCQNISNVEYYLKIKEQFLNTLSAIKHHGTERSGQQANGNATLHWK